MIRLRNVVVIAILKELSMQVQRFRRFITSARFESSAAPGSSRPAETSLLVLVAEIIIQYSGKTERNDIMIRKQYDNVFLSLFTFFTYLQLQRCE